MQPILYIIVPCYNEETVLPVTAPQLLGKLKSLIDNGEISADSRILFVDDGSSDSTFELIKQFSRQNRIFQGISQSRNRGHQSALLAGLFEAKDKCDITVSIDCDGQDDIDTIDKMVAAYKDGNEVVYAVRNSRKTDSFLKRFTAEGFYRFMKLMGADIIFNHADFRLVSSKVIKHLALSGESSLFLRGQIPLIGFKSTIVYFERKKRCAGDGHYTLKKMFSLATDGITSLSVRPLKLIGFVGGILTALGLILLILSLLGVTLKSPTFTETLAIASLIGGIVTLCLAVVGEYIGKILLEVKERPLYIISERTDEMK